MEKLLPQNIEAERGVLGSIIIDPEAIDRVADFLTASDFYREAHRCIYGVIASLYQCHKEADFITICDELERLNKLADVGGASYITSLINQVPTSGNVEFYGRIVERCSILRRLIHASGEIAAMAYDEVEASVALEKAEKSIYEIGRRQMGSRKPASMAAIMEAAMARLEVVEKARLHGVPCGVPTGFTELDRLTGGLQKSDMIVLASRPGGGKTSMACNIAQHAASAKGGNMPVLIFSLEMSKEQLGLRYLADATCIPSQKLRNATFDGQNDWEHIIGSMGVLSELPLYVEDTGGISLLELRSVARRMVAEHGIELIVIDYLQLMSPPPGERYGNQQEVVSELSRGIKNLARELNIPILLLSQLSRAVESRNDPEPKLSDLRSSGQIEQDADLVWFPYIDARAEQLKNEVLPYPVHLSMPKHRNGPVASLELLFDPAKTRFVDAPVGGTS